MADNWGEGYWGPTQLHRATPVLEDAGSIFRVKVALPGQLITIVTTSGPYATLLTEMLVNCGIKVEAVEA